MTTLLLLVLSAARRAVVPGRADAARRCSTVAHAPAVVLAGRARPLPVPARRAFPWTGVWVLLAWSAGLTVLGRAGLSSGCGDQQALTRGDAMTVVGRPWRGCGAGRRSTTGDDPHAAPGALHRRRPGAGRGSLAPGAGRTSIWVYLVGLSSCVLAVPASPTGDPSAHGPADRADLVLIGVAYVAAAWVADASLGSAGSTSPASSALVGAQCADLGLGLRRLRGIRGHPDRHARSRGGRPGSPSSAGVLLLVIVGGRLGDLGAAPHCR